MPCGRRSPTSRITSTGRWTRCWISSTWTGCAWSEQWRRSTSEPGRRCGPMPDSDPLGVEPTTAARFVFEVDGVEIGVFREVRGLSVNVETVTIREGGENGFAHQMPGRMTWPHLVFRRGVVQSDALFDWLQKSSGEGFAANSNKLTRASGAVTAMSGDGKR